MRRFSCVGVSHCIHMSIPLCGQCHNWLPCVGVQTAVHTGIVQGVQLQSLACARLWSVPSMGLMVWCLRIGIVVFINSLCYGDCS